MHFSRQLAVFVKAGIPILESLSDITEETANKHFKKILVEHPDRPARRKHPRRSGRPPSRGLPALLRGNPRDR